MSWLTSLLVEPLYRLIYGRPFNLNGAVFADGAGDSPSRAQGLVMVADGVGGLDLCGTGLRYVLGAEGLPYAVELFPWGHGFGRWFADLTDVVNRDKKARLVAESIQQFRIAQPDDPVFLVA